MKKILHIDDDRLILATLGNELRSRGYEILSASSAREALALTRRVKPDLALVDIRLSDESGIDLARTLRRDFGVYSIFFTAYNDRELHEEAIKEGTLGYLVKPLDTAKIVPAIEAALDIREELEQLKETKEKLIRAQSVNRNISVAIGIYMERYQVSQIKAFDTLRRYARCERRKLADIADELVHATERRNELIDRIHWMENHTGGEQANIHRTAPGSENKKRS